MELQCHIVLFALLTSCHTKFHSILLSVPMHTQPALQLTMQGIPNSCVDSASAETTLFWSCFHSHIWSWWSFILNYALGLLSPSFIPYCSLIPCTLNLLCSWLCMGIPNTLILYHLSFTYWSWWTFILYSAFSYIVVTQSLTPNCSLFPCTLNLLCCWLFQIPELHALILCQQKPPL